MHACTSILLRSIFFLLLLLSRQQYYYYITNIQYIFQKMLVPVFCYFFSCCYAVTIAIWNLLHYFFFLKHVPCVSTMIHFLLFFSRRVLLLFLRHYHITTCILLCTFGLCLHQINSKHTYIYTRVCIEQNEQLGYGIYVYCVSKTYNKPNTKTYTKSIQSVYMYVCMCMCVYFYR